LIDAYPEAFEAQMRYVAAHWNVVSSWDLVRALREDYTLPRRALVITFDDGYRCFLDTAMPVLRRLGLPVTIFVPTGFPDEPGKLFWWDELHRALLLTERPPAEALHLGANGHVQAVEDRVCSAQYIYKEMVSRMERMEEGEARRLLDAIIEWSGVEPNRRPHMLTWQELQSLESEGVAVGPHTRSHIILSQATPERISEEVAGSWADLRRRMMMPLPIFCYPNGKPHAINRTVAGAVKQSGLAGAVTMVAGLNRIGRTNPYLMRRVGAVEGESLARFRFKIGRAGRVYRRVKALVRQSTLRLG
jgi:peptidoglycan/xylan/chitin deacetylase (PgdA/CDA1 family)